MTVERRLLRPIHGVVGWDGFWWVAGMAAILVIGVLLSWCFWDELRGDQDSLSTTIRNVGLVIGGLVALLLAAWRGVVADRQASAAEYQATMTRRSLLNERYQKGAEMLGSEILSVRLGGVYALQRLAENYRQSYHVQVMELFCAFVRNPKEDESYQRMLAEKNADPKTFSFLREDVQAVMDWIGSRGEALVMELADRQLESLALVLHHHFQNRVQQRLVAPPWAPAVYERLFHGLASPGCSARCRRDVAHRAAFLARLVAGHLFGGNSRLFVGSVSASPVLLTRQLRDQSP